LRRFGSAHPEAAPGGSESLPQRAGHSSPRKERSTITEDKWAEPTPISFRRLGTSPLWYSARTRAQSPGREARPPSPRACLLRPARRPAQGRRKQRPHFPPTGRSGCWSPSRPPVSRPHLSPFSYRRLRWNQELVAAFSIFRGGQL
jgi:hypothetical protein